MKSFKEIKSFIDECFQLYSLEYEDFFENGVAFKGNYLSKKKLEYLSEILGLEVEDIINTNIKAMNRIYEKYEYFKLKYDVTEDWFWESSKNYSLRGERDATQVMFNILFGIKENTLNYDPAEVKRRLIKELKEYDKLVPGTYHNNAEVVNVKIVSEVFAPFPKINQLVTSYLEMIERIEKLFFSILHGQLTNDEINEYNILVSYFGIKELLYGTQFMHYKYVLENKKIYIAEGYKDFFSYVRFEERVEPWRSPHFYLGNKSFLDNINEEAACANMELIERFLDRFPDSIYKMREFSNKVSHFYCTYTWSDCDLPIYDDIDEDERFELFMDDLFNMEEIEAIFGEDSDDEYEVSDDEDYQPSYQYREGLYVEKTEKEKGKDAAYAILLQRTLLPPSQGGVKIKRSKEYKYWWHDLLIGRDRAECSVANENEIKMQRMYFREKFVDENL